MMHTYSVRQGPPIFTGYSREGKTREEKMRAPLVRKFVRPFQVVDEIGRVYANCTTAQEAAEHMEAIKAADVRNAEAAAAYEARAHG